MAVAREEGPLTAAAKSMVDEASVTGERLLVGVAKVARAGDLSAES